MNNFTIGLKKFFTNKNVVTIILVLAALGLLYWGYTSTIKRETNPVSVPVATQNINPKTKISSEMITYKNLPASMLNENVIRSTGLLVDRYTNINVTVPSGSPFYTDWVVNGEDLPGMWIEQLDRDKELPFYFDVDSESTLGNAVMPKSYIDFYMRATDENGTIMFGRFMKDINVLVVHDGEGKDVFEDQNAISSPSKLGFAVSQDYYILLKKAEFLGVELVIVPRGSAVPTCAGECMYVTSSTLRDYIDAQTITVEEDVIAAETQPETQTEDSTQQNTNNG